MVAVDVLIKRGEFGSHFACRARALQMEYNLGCTWRCKVAVGQSIEPVFGKFQVKLNWKV